MNSVQENKNELEAAVRYCESAISRAKATIESMEFRQQAATKAWHEQTGREASLEREVSELKQANMGLVCDNDDLKDEITDLKMQIEGHRTNMALLTDETEELKVQLGEREDKWDDAMNENRELHKKIQTMEQTMQLQKEQIAMFQRKMSRLNEVDR